MKRPTKFERLGATAMLYLSWQLSYIPAAVVPQFADVFEGFGEQAIPYVTEMVIRFPEAFLLIPLIHTIAYLLYWMNVPHSVRIQVICIALTALAIPAAILLMYLPIFGLGGFVEG